MKFIIVAFCLLMSLNVSSSSVMNAEFRTLKKCLTMIPKASKQKIKKVIRDTPDIVTGILTNGKTFACERKVTGTKGTYYHGWFMTD